MIGSRLFVKNNGEWVEVVYIGQMSFRFYGQDIINDLFDYDYRWQWI